MIMAIILLFNLTSYLQEIKFEPGVMCEHLDKKNSFRLCQVMFHSYLQRFFSPVSLL